MADGEIDIEKLRQLLGQDATTGAERFGLFWPGKGQAIRAAQLPSTATLQPVPEQSKNWDETQNVFIEGDNLEVLKTLQRHYHGKVKLIYIDPPYNTGKDFVYRDKYQEGLQTYLEWTQQLNSEGQKTSPNSETAGRYHSNWLNMIYPRLKLARNLLAEDGVICISIDDNEISNLRTICDEIFGETNFQGDVITIANPGGRDYKQIAITHEHLLIYSKSDDTTLNEIAKDVSFSMTDDAGGFDLRELRNRNPKFHRGNRPNLFYAFYTDPKNITQDGYCSISLTRDSKHCIEVFPVNSEGRDSCWRWGTQKSGAAIKSGDPFNSEVVARQKRDGGWNIYEKSRRATSKAKSLWDETEMRTENGTRMLRGLFGSTLFDHPKPLTLIQRCLEIGAAPDSLILDFFAGSATTAHAVMQLNAEDGGQRRFILVQLPEPTPADSEARKAGFATIADISRRRIELAGEKIKAEMGEQAAGLDVGFRAYKLADTQFAKWRVGSDSTPQALQHSLLAQRNGADDAASSAALLTEVLLKMGYALSERSSSRNIAGLPWQQVGQAGGAMPPLLAYMDEHQPPTLEQLRAAIDSAAAEAMRVLLLEDALAGNDALKTNALEYAKAHGVELKTA